MKILVGANVGATLSLESSGDDELEAIVVGSSVGGDVSLLSSKVKLEAIDGDSVGSKDSFAPDNVELELLIVGDSVGIKVDVLF